MTERRDDLSTADLASQQPTDTARPHTEAEDVVPDVDVEPDQERPPHEDERPRVAETDRGPEPVRQADAGVAGGDTTPGGPSAGPLLAGNDAEGFRARWTDVQNGFVDSPRQAVEQADELVAALMQQLARTFADERDRLERQWDRGDEVSTDDLRSAFQRYRSFFERLLAT
jgi:hypothetical protein